MHFLKRRSFRILYILLSVLVFTGFTDKDLPLEKEDKKKLEKALKLNQEAQEINDKANAVYSELAQFDKSDESNFKKIDKLEKEAIDLQLKALNLQGEANWLERSIYKKVIPILKSEFSKNNSVPIEFKLLEERIEELILKAENFRNEVEKLGKDELYSRFSKLSEAQKLEKESIVNQKELINYYLGKKTIDLKNQNIGSQYEKEVRINDDLLRAYLNYVNSQDTLVSVDVFRNVMYSDQFSVSSFRDAWYDYLYTEVVYTDRSDSLEISIIAETDPEITEKETDQHEETEKEDILRGAIYKVQIAANSSPLSQHHLKKVYDGNKKVQMVSEDGWYKYSIGDFNSYEEAEEFKRSLKITDAFVVAYTDNKKVDMLVSNKDSQSSKKPTTDSGIKGLIFKVQIAASKNKLSDAYLKEIYEGNETIGMLTEDNWYKYSLGNFNKYDQALDLKNQINIHGAFIVAYQNGVKVPLHLAKKGVVSTKTPEQIVFKVQIAADIKPLSSEKLHNIYSGYEKIIMFNEDGWFKYSIGEFKTFNEANNLRKACNVDGAFVIAFRGNEKMNVLEAKRMTRCKDPIFNTDWLSENTELVFKVQIAASLKVLNEDQIKNICCIEKDVYVTKEDEWYRYSIGSFELYNDAVRLKEISNVNGAFIVAYQNGGKIRLKEAINISNK